MREIEEEFITFIEAWASAIISISYCYYISQNIKAGFFRLISLLPVGALFFVLPLFFSSAHFSFLTSGFLTWQANLKLLLFAFDKSPLSTTPPNLIHFLCFICLPIYPQRNPNSQDPFPKWLFAVKVLLFGVVLHVCSNHIEKLHPILLLGLYPLHVYLSHEIPLTLLNDLLTITLGCDLEPQFNEPYLATSLQDFWGRRWNLPVSALLRSSVFIPVRRVCSHLMNSERAAIIGVLASFLVSGLLHEMMFFYITREAPTWEVTWYFVLHGVCTVAEVIVKRKKFVGRWMVRPVVSRLLTVGFVVLSGGWLFFPQIKRSGVIKRFASESLLFTDLIKHDLSIFLGLVEP
ncbi:PREDICTED: probable long-chain-alcohol O-fatty-acyltransferase 4 [Camelina sativa]|uniref:Probable long-chain-alcohol O-fatty-acyltransferase 4 n=1 Tax=Camelina sativa TaxID=90675 RepID=A0ABM0UTK0_CAMSA|nr:PREDICTED: probable long-chain-alcohol O-fatty-acyltransferase 4 [Camelina sativa]